MIRVGDEMTLDEAIRHCEEVADGCLGTECEVDHRQLAAWLKELKERRSSAQGHENDHIAEVSKMNDTIQALYSILDYAGLGIAVIKLNSCNDCGARRNCKYVPEWGGHLRFNCPLWKGEKDD